MTGKSSSPSVAERLTCLYQRDGFIAYLPPFLVLVWGIILLVSAKLLGIWQMTNSKGVEVGFFSHFHMSIWHVFIVPLILYISIRMFYKYQEDSLRRLVKNEVLTIDGLTDEKNASEFLINSFCEQRRWLGPAFYWASVLFTGVYASNMGLDFYKPGNLGYMQVALYPGEYSVAGSVNQTLMGFFCYGVVVWAILSLILLGHLILCSIAYMRSILSLFPGRSKTVRFHGKTVVVLLKAGDSQKRFGLQPLYDVFDTFQYLGSVMVLVVVLNHFVHIAGTHGTLRVALWLAGGAVAPMALLFLLPLLMTGMKVKQHRDLLHDENVPKERDSEKVKKEKATVLANIEKQKIWPSGSNSVRVLLFSIFLCILLLGIESYLKSRGLDVTRANVLKHSYALLPSLVAFVKNFKWLTGLRGKGSGD